MSQHHKARWSTTEAAAWRKRIGSTLPAACVDCGMPVYPQDKWQVGHIIPLSDPNGPGNVAENLGPSHAKAPGQRACNQIAGGRLGSKVTNAKRGNVDKGRRMFEL